MPRFDVDEIRIDPDDFIDACSDREIKELAEIIKEQYPEYLEDIIDDIDINRGIRSESQRVFNRHLMKLRQEWYSISPKDASIIAILAKKYGAV